jgi:hypothetical protein
MVELQRMPKENPRVEFGRLDTRGAELLRKCAARLCDRSAAQVRDHASSAASSSA